MGWTKDYSTAISLGYSLCQKNRYSITLISWSRIQKHFSILFICSCNAGYVCGVDPYLVGGVIGGIILVLVVAVLVNWYFELW